jgi:hypothetical protein
MIYVNNGLVPKVDILSQRAVDELRKIKKVGNLQKIRKVIGDNKLKKLIAVVYPKYDVMSLEKILGIPNSTLSYWFAKLGIKTSRRNVNNKSFPANLDGLVVFSKNGKATKYSAIKIDKDVSYLIGFVLGDGSTQKFMVEAFNKDFGMRNKLIETMQKYGPVTEDFRDNGLWRIRLSSVKISDLIKRNKKPRKETIEFILRDDELTKQFIAGLWDAEGSVLKQGNYKHVYLYNSDKYLIDLVGEFLKSKEIKYSILALKNRRKSYFCKGHLVVPKKTIYRLGVPKSHVKKWAEEIGLHLLHSKKGRIVEEILQKGGE